MMEGFIAKIGGHEEFVTRRDGSELKKLRRVVSRRCTLDKEVHKEIITETRTIYLVKGNLRALAAFHTEKEKARKEGFAIQNFDSTTEAVEKKTYQDFSQRKRKILGRFVEE